MVRRGPTGFALPRSRPARDDEGRSGATIAYAGGAGAVLAMLLARAMAEGRVLYPGCGFRWLTGRPCPGCGGTHALAALADGAPLAALAHNPLVALVASALAVLAVAVALDRGATGGRLARSAIPSLRGAARRAGWWAAVAVGVNWVYLLCFAE